VDRRYVRAHRCVDWCTSPRCGSAELSVGRIARVTSPLSRTLGGATASRAERSIRSAKRIRRLETRVRGWGARRAGPRARRSSAIRHFKDRHGGQRRRGRADPATMGFRPPISAHAKMSWCAARRVRNHDVPRRRQVRPSTPPLTNIGTRPTVDPRPRQNDDPLERHVVELRPPPLANCTDEVA